MIDRMIKLCGEVHVKTLIAALSVLFSTVAHGQQPHRCAADALKQAKALLVFHTAGDSRASIDDHVKVLPPLRNPVNRRQYFEVLEVQGYVYKANYQMRLIYAQIPGTCVLMGQEILERSSP